MANLIKSKTVVLDRRTSKNPSIDLGDFVTCCNCGRTMLVNVGTDVCPEFFFHYSEDYMLADTES